MSDEWESEDDYPWIPVEHRPPPIPKDWRSDRYKKVKRDYNKPGPIPTAYRVRIADDGTKWHSFVDILRPNSPPVEWPEYPDKPVEDDIPPDFDWDQVSDWDLDDPEFIMDKLGVPKTERFNIGKKELKVFKNLKRFKDDIMSKNPNKVKKEFKPPVVSSPCEVCPTGCVSRNPELEPTCSENMTVT